MRADATTASEIEDVLPPRALSALSLNFFLMRAPDSFFSPIALADVASDDLIRCPRQRMCPAGSGFGQLRRWEWIWTLLKR